jgi:Fuc2NAc and GlcNAc transferase
VSVASVVFLAGLALVSWAATSAVRRYALARSMVDVPGDRSSHTVPTPRGGGLAIAISSLAGIVALSVAGVLAANVATAIAGGGAMVALVGWMDDHRDVAARWRLSVHFTAAAWFLAWTGGLSHLLVGDHRLELGAGIGSLLAAARDRLDHRTSTTSWMGSTASPAARRSPSA